MKLEGGCRCGAVRYRVEGEPAHRALCHCTDCRKSSGAPMVAWAAFPEAGFTILSGEPGRYNGEGASIRHFCPTCGTPLWFVNAQVLPGLVDLPIATFDDPEVLAPEVQIQVADRITWMSGIADLPEFERYPGE
ncbi:GFA family protein [Novosphingobium profundi]|uniref:GFA family protein n=1 Tax=Novosphingobium profundi TaxID=1774954 RepID=UPI001CFC74C1|nr:GFA family protein [Novosphingobium profundi]